MLRTWIQRDVLRIEHIRDVKRCRDVPVIVAGVSILAGD
jgi:hypothetical protein